MRKYQGGSYDAILRLLLSYSQGNSTFQLGSDKARSVQARFLIAPVENRTYHFHGIRLRPTVCLEVISLVASGCGYYRGEIAQRVVYISAADNSLVLKTR
jgi:hypothetical protein